MCLSCLLRHFSVEFQLGWGLSAVVLLLSLSEGQESPPLSPLTTCLLGDSCLSCTAQDRGQKRPVAQSSEEHILGIGCHGKQ